MLEQLGVIAGMLGRQSPWVDTSLRDAAEDLVAFTALPRRTGSGLKAQTLSNR